MLVFLFILISLGFKETKHNLNSQHILRKHSYFFTLHSPMTIALLVSTLIFEAYHTNTYVIQAHLSKTTSNC